MAIRYVKYSDKMISGYVLELSPLIACLTSQDNYAIMTADRRRQEILVQTDYGWCHGAGRLQIYDITGAKNKHLVPTFLL